MQQPILDEAQMIEKIRECGQFILADEQQQSISYTFSDSSNIQERIIPTVLRPMRATKNLNKNVSSMYGSIQSQKKQKERFSTIGSSQQYKMISPNIKKRIFNMYQQQRLVQQSKSKSKSKKSPTRQYNSTKPKYLKREPIVKNLSGYIQKNVYGRMKLEAEHLRPPRSMSRQQKQQRWEEFLKKSQEWQQQRQNSRIKAKINQNMIIGHEISTRPARKSPPKMTVDDCLQKLRRQAERLKQKLELYSFEPKTYQVERNSRKYSKNKYYDSNKKRNPQQLTQKKFTVVKNPKKQLQFMFN